MGPAHARTRWARPRRGTCWRGPSPGQAETHAPLYALPPQWLWSSACTGVLFVLAAHGYALPPRWLCLRNSVHLCTCTGRQVIKFLVSAFGRDCSWSAISTLHPLRQRLPPLQCATSADNTNINVNTGIGEGGKNNTNGGNHTNNASSRTGAFSGYYTTLIILVLNMLLDALIIHVYHHARITILCECWRLYY